jgi:hypothetical protein
MPHDPKVIPILRGRLVLVAERYGTPRVLVTSAVRNLGYPAKACPTGADALASWRYTRTACTASWPMSASRTWMVASWPHARSRWFRGFGWC